MSLVCPKASSLSEEPLFQGVELIDLPFSRSGTYVFGELKLLFNLFKLFKRQAKGTLVHNFTIKPILYSNLLRRLFFSRKLYCFSTFTGLGYLFSDESKKKGLQKLVARLLRFCLFKYSSSVIFQNHCDQKTFIDRKIVDQKSNVILGSGVDTEHFYMSAKEPDSPLKYLFIGRILVDKGVFELLEAFKNFIQKHPKTAVLKIAGDFDKDNPQFITPEDFKEKVTPEIDYVGYKNDLRPLIEDADVVVLPSYREGLPLALIQSCSMGKSILTTEAPGCKEMVVGRKNGFKVEARSASNLEEAFVKFNKLSSEELFQMAKESRILAESVFSSKVVNQQIESLYSNT